MGFFTLPKLLLVLTVMSLGISTLYLPENDTAEAVVSTAGVYTFPTTAPEAPVMVAQASSAVSVRPAPEVIYVPQEPQVLHTTVTTPPDPFYLSLFQTLRNEINNLKYINDRQTERVFDNTSESIEEISTLGDLTLTDTLTGTDAVFSSDVTLESLVLTDTTPDTTTNRLYATAGDLYYAGNVIGGATTGNWTSDGTHAWRASGNVGVGTSSPYAKLSVAGDTAIDGSMLVSQDSASFYSGTSTPPTGATGIINSWFRSGDVDQYVAFRAGATQDYRSYLAWYDYGETVHKWLMGRNATNAFTLYDSAGSTHRLYAVSGGETRLDAAGSSAVEINGNGDSGSGTGGLSVYSGGTSPQEVFKVSSYTATDSILQATSNGSGYAPASLKLTSTNSNARGQGIFHYNAVSDTSWFTGVPYAVTGTKWMVGYKPDTVWNPDVAQTTYGLMTIQNDGKVGIGTTSPASALDITGSSNQAQLNVRSYSTQTNYLAQFFGSNGQVALGITGTGQIQRPTSSSGDLVLTNLNNSSISFRTNGDVEKARITGAGLVGIGTTTPAYKLDVYRSDDGVVASFTDLNGVCTIDPTTTSLSCSSDKRLKKDITKLSSTDILTKLTALQGVTYLWNTQQDDTAHIGFIAQDVEAIFPEFVSTGPTGMKAVSYGSFAPVLVESIKALNLKIEDLEARIASTTPHTLTSSITEWIGEKLTAVTGYFTTIFAERVETDAVDANTINSKGITTDELCIEDICVTKEELKEMLKKTGVRKSNTENDNNNEDENTEDQNEEEESQEEQATTTDEVSPPVEEGDEDMSDESELEETESEQVETPVEEVVDDPEPVVEEKEEIVDTPTDTEEDIEEDTEEIQSEDEAQTPEETVDTP